MEVRQLSLQYNGLALIGVAALETERGDGFRCLAGSLAERNHCIYVGIGARFVPNRVFVGLVAIG